MDRRLGVVVCLLLALLPVAYAEYAKTTVYFNAPTVTTFTIRMPDTYSGAYEVAITGTSEASATTTPWISFNASSLPQNYIEPYVEGNTSKAQNGTAQPIFWIENTGNVAINISMYWSASLPTGWTVWWNGTCTSCTAVNTVTLTGVGETNAQQVVIGLAVGAFANLTAFANASASAVDGNVDLYTKSTT